MNSQLLKPGICSFIFLIPAILLNVVIFSPSLLHGQSKRIEDRQLVIQNHPAIVSQKYYGSDDFPSFYILLEEKEQYHSKRDHFKITNHSEEFPDKVRTDHLTTINSNEETTSGKAQVKPPRYFIGRNEVFRKLPNDPDEIIMLGNSLTHNFEWHEIFKNVTIKNRGINSDTTKGILYRLDEVLESKPIKIFIEIGINDLLHGLQIDTIYSNYNEIIREIQIKSPETRIYIQNILPTNWLIYKTDKPVIDSVYVLNKKLKDLCENKHLTHIDLFSAFIEGQQLNLEYDCGDKLHLSGEGYLEWCRLIKDYIYE